ncbi:MAG: hypothetical protein HQK52_14280 [Oligoflexia bacterium]|nr:hypothetical protein [Oligoflexia bacterium]
MTISLGLMAVTLFLIFQLGFMFKRSISKVEKTSFAEKYLAAQALTLTQANFLFLQQICDEAKAYNYKCDNDIRPDPSQYLGKGAFLYRWIKINNLSEYCIDIENFELKANENYLDIKLRLLSRRISQGGKTSDADENRFVTFRKGR